MKPFERSFDGTGFVWVYTHFYEAPLFQSLTVEGYMGTTPLRCITQSWWTSTKRGSLGDTLYQVAGHGPVDQDGERRLLGVHPNSWRTTGCLYLPLSSATTTADQEEGTGSTDHPFCTSQEGGMTFLGRPEDPTAKQVLQAPHIKEGLVLSQPFYPTSPLSSAI